MDEPQWMDIWIVKMDLWTDGWIHDVSGRKKTVNFLPSQHGWLDQWPLRQQLKHYSDMPYTMKRR